MTPRVFVGRPSVLSRKQETAAERWTHAIQRMGMKPITPLGAYVEDELWTNLRSDLASADGVLILGFRQLRVDEGCWRPGTLASANPARWWPTSWNHVEAGMAIMAGLPLLIVREDGVSGGVFDSCAWTDGVYGAGLDSTVTQPVVTSWAEDVFSRARIGPVRTAAAP